MGKNDWIVLDQTEDLSEKGLFFSFFLLKFPFPPSVKIFKQTVENKAKAYSIGYLLLAVLGMPHIFSVQSQVSKFSEL